jgi:hypothetical protein
LPRDVIVVAPGRGLATLTAHHSAGEGPVTAAAAEERRRPSPFELLRTVVLGGAATV